MSTNLLVEVCLVDEATLKAFVRNELDLKTREAVEAYLFHHPEVTARLYGDRRVPRPSPRHCQ